jgi:hypothetical protein
MKHNKLLQPIRILVKAVVAAALLGPTQVAGREPQLPVMPATDKASALAQLVRRTSTRVDVERLLGQPSGTGGSRLPPDWQPRELWFYQSISTGAMTTEPKTAESSATTIRMDLNQEILLVFFAGESYDGYMWYTNIGLVEGKVP